MDNIMKLEYILLFVLDLEGLKVKWIVLYITKLIVRQGSQADCVPPDQPPHRLS